MKNGAHPSPFAVVFFSCLMRYKHTFAAGQKENSTVAG